jgi:hypothetical protein
MLIKSEQYSLFLCVVKKARTFSNIYCKQTFKEMAYRILLRRDTSENWVKAEAVLLEGEPGYETDTGKLKIGDGSNTWSALDYYGGTGATGISGPTGAPGNSNYLTPPSNPPKYTSYTLTSSDVNTIILMNGSSDSNLIVTTNSLVPMEIGSKIMIARGGTGEVSVIGSTSGVVINYPSSFYNKLRATHSIANLIKIDTNVWYLYGDLKSNP